MRTWTPLIILGSVLLACDGGGDAAGGESGIDSSPTSGSSSPDSDTDLGPGTSSTGAGSTSSPDATSSNPVDDDDSEDDGPAPPISFDFGSIPDAGEDVFGGCNAVDFLFVIDNSGSMGGAQANLVANFPTFIDGIQSTLTEVESYQVGVITTDDHTGDGFSQPSNPPECRQLGALVTSTAGLDSSNATCGPYAEGFNFITTADDLAESFECAASVGTQGNFIELTMNAMEAAISEELNAPGACNERFIRPEALLVVVIITDEADGPGDPDGAPPANSSTGTPETWYQSVLDAKNGIPENAAAVVSGHSVFSAASAVVLTNYAKGPCEPLSSVNDGVNMVDFANLFGENGFVAGICEPDYGPSFNSAIELIQDACENFIPPG